LALKIFKHFLIFILKCIESNFESGSRWVLGLGLDLDRDGPGHLFSVLGGVGAFVSYFFFKAQYFKFLFQIPVVLKKEVFKILKDKIQIILKIFEHFFLKFPSILSQCATGVTL